MESFKCAPAGALQLELTDLQADVALRANFEISDSINIQPLFSG